MKRIALIFACLFAAFAHAAPNDGIEELEYQMSYFYLSPSKTSFELLQQLAGQHSAKFKSSGNGAEMLMATLISKASQAHGWPIQDGPFAKLAREISAGTSDVAKFVSDDRVVDPSKLDTWWVSFFATGDSRYLENLLVYAGEEMPEKDIEHMLVIGAATWSFTSNCHQHERVRAFAQQKLSGTNLSTEKITYLQQCVAAGKARTLQPDSASDAPAQATKPAPPRTP